MLRSSANKLVRNFSSHIVRQCKRPLKIVHANLFGTIVLPDKKTSMVPPLSAFYNTLKIYNVKPNDQLINKIYDLNLSKEAAFIHMITDDWNEYNLLCGKHYIDEYESAKTTALKMIKTYDEVLLELVKDEKNVRLIPDFHDTVHKLIQMGIVLINTSSKYNTEITNHISIHLKNQGYGLVSDTVGFVPRNKHILMDCIDHLPKFTNVKLDQCVFVSNLTYDIMKAKDLHDLDENKCYTIGVTDLASFNNKRFVNTCPDLMINKFSSLPKACEYIMCNL